MYDVSNILYIYIIATENLRNIDIINSENIKKH